MPRSVWGLLFADLLHRSSAHVWAQLVRCVAAFDSRSCKHGLVPDVYGTPAYQPCHPTSLQRLSSLQKARLTADDLGALNPELLQHALDQIALFTPGVGLPGEDGTGRFTVTLFDDRDSTPIYPMFSVYEHRLRSALPC